MNDPRQPESWIQSADSDFRVIAACVNSNDTPWEMVAFHAQQAAEKLLKCYCAAKRGEEPEKTHDLPILLGQCCAVDATLTEISADCGLLNRYAIAPRYPVGSPLPTQAEAERAVAAAERIRDVIRQRLGL